MITDPAVFCQFVTVSVDAVIDYTKKRLSNFMEVSSALALPYLKSIFLFLYRSSFLNCCNEIEFVLNLFEILLFLFNLYSIEKGYADIIEKVLVVASFKYVDDPLS